MLKNWHMCLEGLVQHGLEKLSDEQREFALEVHKQERNLTLQAVPGAGKTTTLIQIQKMLTCSVLGLTYSSKLKAEWREKHQGNVHSFHSFALLLSQSCNYKRNLHTVFDDKAVRKFLKQKPVGVLPDFDVCLIDEVQDMSQLHFHILEWYAKYSQKKMQFVLVGQEQQCVYDYKVGDEKADLEYLLNPAQKFSEITDKKWSSFRLTQSFRLSKHTASFVNEFFHLPAVSHIKGLGQSSNKVHYYCIDLFHFRKVVHYVSQYIRKYGSANVQIISAVREKSFDKSVATKVLNQLSLQGFLVKTCDSQLATQQEGAGQLQRYTLPSCKGTECECTIVLGADQFFDFTTDAQQFVAMTRPKKQLVLLQHSSNLPWQGWSSPAKITQLHSVDVTMVNEFKVHCTTAHPRMAFVSSMLDIQEDVSDTEFFEETMPVVGCVKYESVVQFQTEQGQWYSENVSNLYGSAIALLAEYNTTHKVPLFYSRIFNAITVSSGNMYGSLIKQSSVKVKRALKELEKSKAKRTERMSERNAIRHVKDTLHVFMKNGLISPSEHEQKCKHLIGCSDFLLRFPLHHRDWLQEMLPPDKKWDAKDAFIAASAGNAFDRSHVQMLQLQHYNFVQESVIEDASEWIVQNQKHTPTAYEVMLQCRFTQPVQVSSLPPFEGIFGFADAVCELEDETIVYEYKFTNELGSDAKLQALIYMHLYVLQNVERTQKITGCIMNARTEQVLEYQMVPDLERSRQFISNVFEQVYLQKASV